jgi:hypothetical protein
MAGCEHRWTLGSAAGVKPGVFARPMFILSSGNW